MIRLYKNVSATHLLLVIYWRFICIQTFIVYAHGSKSAMSVGWNINTIDNTDLSCSKLFF